MEALTGIIITFNGRSISHQRIEHQPCVHECFVSCAMLAQIPEGLDLRGWQEAISHPNPLAVPAIRAEAVYGDVARGTGNRDPVFCGVALEWKSFHTHENTRTNDMRISIKIIT